MKTLLILILGASSLAHAAPSALTPEAGPHSVGLRVVQQYDYSRVIEPTVDPFGKAQAAAPGGQSRHWSGIRQSALLRRP